MVAGETSPKHRRLAIAPKAASADAEADILRHITTGGSDRACDRAGRAATTPSLATRIGPGKRKDRNPYGSGLSLLYRLSISTSVAVTPALLLGQRFRGALRSPIAQVAMGTARRTIAGFTETDARAAAGRYVHAQAKPGSTGRCRGRSPRPPGRQRLPGR